MTHDELVDKMLDAQDGSNRSDVWRTYCPEDKRRFRLAMSAALRVAVEELLKAPTKEEGYATHWRGDVDLFITFARHIFAARRSKLERPKTPEERVTVVPWVHDPNLWIALVDGWNTSNNGGFKDKLDAEIYRKGLIADLKERGE